MPFKCPICGCRKRTSTEAQPLLIAQQPTVQEKPSTKEQCLEIIELTREGCVLIPDYFFSSFTWQCVADLAGKYLNLPTDVVPGRCCECTGDCMAFSCMVGMGEAAGTFATTFCTQSIAYGTRRSCPHSWFATCVFGRAGVDTTPLIDWKFFLRQTLLNATFYGAATFASGALWQIIVNVMLEVTVSLLPKFAAVVATSAVTGAACGLAFLCVLIALRKLLHTAKIKEYLGTANVPEYNRAQWLEDIKISLWNVSFAAAAFLLGVYLPDTFASAALFDNMLLSASTALIGYGISECISVSVKSMLICCDVWTPKEGWKKKSPPLVMTQPTFQSPLELMPGQSYAGPIVATSSESAV